MTPEDKENTAADIALQLLRAEEKAFEAIITRLLDGGFTTDDIHIKEYDGKDHRDLICDGVVAARSRFIYEGTTVSYECTPYPNGQPLRARRGPTH